MMGLEIFCILLLIFLAVCALAVVFTRNLLTAVIIYTVFGVVMSIVWLLLEAPDLAITEAAVGVGISGILFFILLKRIHRVKKQSREEQNDE